MRYCLKFISIFILIVSAGSTHAISSKSTIAGRVIDKESQDPIPFVSVYIKSIARGDVSDKDGLFAVTGLPPGTYDVIFQRQGYKEVVVKQVRLKSNSNIMLNTEMIEAIIETDEMVVTATRNAEFEHDIPQLVSVVTGKEIREKNNIQIPEFLREEEGVYVQKTNQGGGSPVVRGLKANKLLFLVDGVRLNNSTFRGGNVQYLNTIDPGSLARMEIIHGPVSTLYGSDALGGAINMITKRPDFGTTSAIKWGAAFTSLLSTADASRSGHIGVQGANDTFGFLVDATYRSFGDITRGGNGGSELMLRLENDSRVDRLLEKKQSPNGYESYDFMTKAVWQAASSHEFTVLYQINRQPEVPRYDVQEAQKDAKFNYAPQERDFAYLTYKYSRPNTFFNYATITSSVQRQYERRIRQKKGKSTETSDAFGTTTLGLQAQFNKIVLRDHFIAYGFEIYADDVSAESFSKDLNTGIRSDRQTLYPDGADYLNLGAFVQAELSISQKWIVDFGMRYSRFKLNASFADESSIGAVEQSPQALTASLSSRLQLSENINFVSNLAQGFRAPNLDDVSKLGIGKGGSFYEVPNPDAGPERITSIDAGFKMKFDALRANIIGYYSQLTDALVRRQTTFNGADFFIEGEDSLRLFRKENAAKAFITGIGTNINMALSENITVSGTVTYTYGQNETDDAPMPAMPPLNGQVGLRYNAKMYWAEVFTRFATTQDRLSAEDLSDLRIPEGGTPGWFTLNVRGARTISPTLSLNFSVNNILDLNYREHLSGFNAPGRNFIVQGEIKF